MPRFSATSATRSSICDILPRSIPLGRELLLHSVHAVPFYHFAYTPCTLLTAGKADGRNGAGLLRFHTTPKAHAAKREWPRHAAYNSVGAYNSLKYVREWLKNRLKICYSEHTHAFWTLNVPRLIYGITGCSFMPMSSLVMLQWCHTHLYAGSRSITTFCSSDRLEAFIALTKKQPKGSTVGDLTRRAFNPPLFCGKLHSDSAFITWTSTLQPILRGWSRKRLGPSLLLCLTLHMIAQNDYTIPFSLFPLKAFFSL